MVATARHGPLYHLGAGVFSRLETGEQGFGAALSAMEARLESPAARGRCPRSTVR